MQENSQLKKQINSGSFVGNGPSVSVDSAPKPKRDFKTMRAERKKNAEKQFEEFNQKFLTDL